MRFSDIIHSHSHTNSSFANEDKGMSQLKMLWVYFCGTGSSRGAAVLTFAVHLLF